MSQIVYSDFTYFRQSSLIYYTNEGGTTVLCTCVVCPLHDALGAGDVSRQLQVDLDGAHVGAHVVTHAQVLAGLGHDLGTSFVSSLVYSTFGIIIIVSKAITTTLVPL